MSPGAPILLAIQHVSWEGPHRILAACEELEVRTVEPLVDAWLAEPQMAAEASAALGPGASAQLRRDARAAESELIARSTPGFQTFARLVAAPGGRI